MILNPNLARNCLENEAGDMLLKTLTKKAKQALNGLILTLSNIEEQSLKLPEQDRHLLNPPADLPISDLYDIMNIIKIGRTPVQARRIFSRLVVKYYDLDRNLRVSVRQYFVKYRISSLNFYIISQTYSVWTGQKS